MARGGGAQCQAHAPSTNVQAGDKQRGRETEGVIAACLGPPLKKAEASHALGSVLEVRCRPVYAHFAGLYDFADKPALGPVSFCVAEAFRYLLPPDDHRPLSL